MAKFGEGDPRWLVEERSDGRNVNAWHWEEKNVTNDALTRFKNLFQSFQLTDDQLFKISKVHSVTGDVTFCVRKQKPILLFELNAIFNWDGELKGQQYTGQIICEEMAVDEPVDDWKFKITCALKNELSDGIISVIKEQGLPKIRQQCEYYIDQLKTDYSKGIPISDSLKSSTDGQSTKQSSSSSIQSTRTSKGSISTKNIQISLQYREPSSILFDCFIDPARISAFTQSPTKIRPEIQSEFELFDGNIHGTIIDLDRPNKLVMKWRFKNWPTDHFSLLTIQFESIDGGKTLLKLKQEGVPVEDFDRTLSGWKSNFWDRMKMVFGFEYKEK